MKDNIMKNTDLQKFQEWLTEQIACSEMSEQYQEFEDKAYQDDWAEVSSWKDFAEAKSLCKSRVSEWHATDSEGYY